MKSSAEHQQKYYTVLHSREFNVEPETESAHFPNQKNLKSPKEMTFTASGGQMFGNTQNSLICTEEQVMSGKGSLVDNLAS